MTNSVKLRMMSYFAPAVVGLAFVVAPALQGCATPGTNPQDMSAAGHELAAAKEEAAGRCPPGANASDPCWTSLKSYQQKAAEHRAAGQALRDAEARACSGVPNYDRNVSPFLHSEDIEQVAPLNVPRTWSGEGQIPSQHDAVFKGAVISFRPVRGLTQEWLQRVIDCHLARNAVLGNDLAEMPNCPLVPKDVTAQAKSAGDHFVVEVSSDDPATAQEVWRRAQRLVPSAKVSAKQ
jgi:hypothetical protein